MLEAIFRIRRIRKNSVEFCEVFEIKLFIEAREDIVEPSDEFWDFGEISFSLIKKISWRSVTIVVFFCSLAYVSHSSETIPTKDDDIVFFKEFCIVGKKEFEPQVFESVIDDEGKFSWKPRESTTEKSRHDGDDFSGKSSSA